MFLGVVTCVFYVALCLLVGLLTSSFDFSIKLLDGLKQFYVQDEDSGSNKKEETGNNQNNNSNNTINSRKKAAKKKDEDWINAGGSKLLSLNVQPIHILTRTHYKEYNEVVTFLVLGFVVLLSCDILHRSIPESYHEVIDGGDIVALLLGTMTIWRVIRNVSQVQWEKSSSSSLDIQISTICGIGGFLLSFYLLLSTPNSYFDFSFEDAIVDAGKVIASHLNSKLENEADPIPPIELSVVVVKGIFSLIAGFETAFLLPSAIRWVRCYYVSTFPDDMDITILKRHWVVRSLLHISMVLPIITLCLWVKPMTSLFVYQQDSGSRKIDGEEDVGDIQDWDSSFGVSVSSLNFVRMTLLTFSGLLFILMFRINVQSHLNTAILTWYKILHGSIETEVNYLKARTGLTSHILSRVAMQSLLPGAIPLILLGLSRTRCAHLDAKAVEKGFLFPPFLMREGFIFLAWWSNSVWALETCVILAGFRIGIFQAS